MRAILICQHQKVQGQFERAIGEHRGLVLSKVLSSFPPSEVLRRVVRAWAPQVVFVELEDSQECEEVNRQLEVEFPWIQRIGLHLSQDSSTFRLALRLRMHEAFVAPFDRSEVGDVLARTAKFLEENPNLMPPANRLIAFVPAKAGVGASTIAANTTWAFGRMQKSHVLLADFDLSSGIAGFLFKAEHDHHISEALARAHDLDDDGWQKLVKKLANVDLLPSGAPYMGDRVTSDQVHKLIEFIRRNYDISSADLSDTFDEISLAVLRDADRIVLVTSPELPAVRMARLKVTLFKKLDLLDKVRLVVNRVRKGTALDLGEIEETVGLTVFGSLPCDYSDVTKSIQNGTASPALSPGVQQLAEKLLDKKASREKRTSFIERFAITPIRHTFR